MSCCFIKAVATFQSEAEVSVVRPQRGSILSPAGEHAVRLCDTSTHQVINENSNITLCSRQRYWRHVKRPAGSVHPCPQPLWRQKTKEKHPPQGLIVSAVTETCPPTEQVWKEEIFDVQKRLMIFICDIFTSFSRDKRLKIGQQCYCHQLIGIK